MPIFKRILLAVILPILPLLLFGIAFSYGLNKVIGNPESVKEILNKSGIYENLIPNYLNSANKKGGSEISIALDDPNVKEAAEKAFTPEFVKESSEKIIDGTFTWLNGKADKPTFNIDLTGVKTAFAVNAGAAAEQKAATLPRCSSRNTPAEFDAFTATCLPTGITPASAAARTQSEILSGQGLLEDSAINAGSLKAEGTNDSVFEQMQSVPKVYQQAKKMPLYLAVLAIIVIAAIIFLGVTRVKGIRQVGFTFIGVGLAMIALSYIVGSGAIELVNLKNNALAGDIKNLIKDLSDAVAANYRLFGGIYTALGLIAVGGAMFISKRNRINTETNKPTEISKAPENNTSKQ